MELQLKNKVVFVTGSARRVGKAIALACAKEGAKIVVHHSNSDDAAAATAQEIGELGVEVLVIKGDHRQHSEIVGNFADIMKVFGRIDVLVNSASIFTEADILEVSPSEWQKVMDINLNAPFYCTQEAGRIMQEQHSAGSIINIGDNGGLRPWAERPQHSVSKAGVIMLTQVAARALAQYQIRVNCVVPGPVLPSPGMNAAHWKKVEMKLPLQRSGNPDDVARAVVFLANNDFITGEILRVDGGEFLGESLS